MKTAYPAAPMSTLPDTIDTSGTDLPTLTKVAEHCRMSSGTHFLDSGGASGRLWQGTPVPPSDVSINLSEYGEGQQELLVSISVVHMLARIGLEWSVQAFLDGEDEAQLAFVANTETNDETPTLSDLRERLKAYDYGEDYTFTLDRDEQGVSIDTSGASWFDHGRMIMAFLGYKCHARDNVYNHDNDYDQVFVWEVWSKDKDCVDWIWADDAVMLVYPHTGADPRGGFAAPLAVDMAGRDGNYLDASCGLYPCDDFTRAWMQEHGDGEDCYSAGYDSNAVSRASNDLDRISLEGETIAFERPGDDMPHGYTRAKPAPPEQGELIPMAGLEHTDGLLRFCVDFNWSQ